MDVFAIGFCQHRNGVLSQQSIFSKDLVRVQYSDVRRPDRNCEVEEKEASLVRNVSSFVRNVVPKHLYTLSVGQSFSERRSLQQNLLSYDY